MKHILILASVLLSLAATAGEPWTPLFDGAGLEGWIQRGGKAVYTVEEGAIVGRTRLNTPNSFLCTDREYADFIFEVEYRVHPRLNSGVQFRSESFDAATSVVLDGKTFKIPAGRVHGYQAEIDPDPVKKRWWSAGVYDESRRAWLYPGALGGSAEAFTAQGAEAFKPGEWNHMRIQAVGDRIRTWLNGAPRAALTDGVTRQGFFGLQVHGVPNSPENENLDVRFRNIRIRPMGGGTAEPNRLSGAEQLEGWTLLWDGESLKGWNSARGGAPGAGWSIRDGVLAVAKGAGDLITEKDYGAFILRVDFRMSEGANSGIMYGVTPGRSPGFEYQLLDDSRHVDAKRGRDGNRTVASLYDLLPAAADKPVNPPGEWNTAMIVVHGTRIEHWLNGERVLEVDRASEAFQAVGRASKFSKHPTFGGDARGRILLQDHGDAVEFRNLKIKALD